MRKNLTFQRAFMGASLLSLSIFNSAGAETRVSRIDLSMGVSVEVREEAFVKSEFKVEGCSSIDKTCLINGQLPYGSSGTLPVTVVNSITAKVGGKTYLLPSNDLYNAWGSKGAESLASPHRHFGGRCDNAESCVFRAVLADGAGTFAVQWEVSNGKVRRTVLTGGSDIINLFMKNIDPPSNVID